MNIVNESLAKNVKKLRTRKKMSQRELARIINVSAGYITCIESGKRFPSSEVLNALANAFEIPISQLFLTEVDLYPNATPEGWFKFRTLIEEVTVCIEEMHDILDKFQK